MTVDYPLVSIITPIYNGGRYIDELILSIQCQDYPNIEHIVIDDGSDDHGATVAALQHYPNIRWWSQTNSGQYSTMNEGLKSAKGIYVCFINADDRMMPGAVRSAVEYLQSHPMYDGIFGDFSNIDSGSNTIVGIHPFRHMPARLYPYTHHICHASLYIRRDFLISGQLWFNKDLRYTGDYEWLIRIIKKKGHIAHLRKVFSEIRIHPEQMTQENFMKMRRELITIQKEQGISLFINSVYRKIMFATRILNTLFNEGLLGAIQVFSGRLQGQYRSKR